MSLSAVSPLLHGFWIPQDNTDSADRSGPREFERERLKCRRKSARGHWLGLKRLQTSRRTTAECGTGWTRFLERPTVFFEGFHIRHSSGGRPGRWSMKPPASLSLNASAVNKVVDRIATAARRGSPSSNLGSARLGARSSGSLRILDNAWCCMAVCCPAVSRLRWTHSPTVGDEKEVSRTKVAPVQRHVETVAAAASIEKK